MEDYNHRQLNLDIVQELLCLRGMSCYPLPPPPRPMWVRPPTLKLVVVGDSGVGKSSLLHRLAGHPFEEHLQPTVGVDFHVKTMRIDDRTVKLTIWDTAGQERFRTLSTTYYRGCHGILLVYDVNNKTSFEHLESWMEEADTLTNRQHVTILLVGNKIDLQSRQLSVEEARRYAKDRAMDYVETSAKTDEGVQPAFRTLVRRILDSLPPETEAEAAETTLATLRTLEKRGCC